MAKLGVNIDHIATVRQARQGAEPDPVWAAVEAELAGADVITLHLREDRRHVQDHDFLRLKSIAKVKNNLEMAASTRMCEFALEHQPQMVTLVPEGREELTTEGGLDLGYNAIKIEKFVSDAQKLDIEVSAFIEPSEVQVRKAKEMGFNACELHTGHWAKLFERKKRDESDPQIMAETHKIAVMIDLINDLGMKANAGHALNYHNVQTIASIPGINELHIGFSIISRALFVGMQEAVKEMKAVLN